MFSRRKDGQVGMSATAAELHCARGDAARACAREETAQGTVEYALTVSALMAIVLALALVFRAGEEGIFAGLVEQASSHGFEGLGILDIALF